MSRKFIKSNVIQPSSRKQKTFGSKEAVIFNNEEGDGEYVDLKDPGFTSQDAEWQMVKNLRDRKPVISREDMLDWSIPFDKRQEEKRQKKKKGNELKKRILSSGLKKIRKHSGIHQTGGKAGKLKKGYKYSGKKLKNGKAEIKKVKSKK
jgi:hypothetical protein